jgi:hypothetical protein
MARCMIFLPPTSDFPSSPETLDRDSLNSTYRELRSCYASSMRSRAQHRRLANRAKDETEVLKQRLTALATRDLPARKEIYEILDIVASIAGDIEDAGDDLVNGFSRYKMGRHTFQGGGYLGELIRAVIHFLNRWGRTKDRLGDLKRKQKDLMDKSKGLLPPPPPENNNGGSKGQPPGPSDPPDGGRRHSSGSSPADTPTESPENSTPPPSADRDETTGAADHG